MKKRVKIWAAIVAGAVCIAVAAFVLTQPLLVEAVAVRPQTVTLTFTETGSYEYSRLYLVYPLVAGEILSVEAQEGDWVDAGDVIAVVSASDYEYQIQQLGSTIAGYSGQLSNLALQEQQEKVNLNATLQQLEGQLVVLDAEVEKNRTSAHSLAVQISIQERIVDINRSSISHARDFLKEMRDHGEDYEIIQARQALNTAENSYAQNRLLLEQLRDGNVPDDLYEGQRQAIEAQIDAVNTQLSQSYTGGMQQYYNAQIQMAQSSIAQMQEKAGQATVTAPVSGVLHELPAKDQNLLSQQTPAASIGGAPLVEVFVPLREIDGVAPGDAVELLLDKRLGSETVAGTVVEIEEEAQVKYSALGVEERKVRVLIEPAQDVLQIGYDMDVRFSPYTFEEVLVIPKTALFQLEGGDCVWVVRDGQLEICAVDKGVETRDGYIIDRGLAEGDLVVADADNGGLDVGKRAAVDVG